jgi:hypothetical protein
VNVPSRESTFEMPLAQGSTIANRPTCSSITTSRSVKGQVAPVPVPFPDHDEGAPGPSPLGTGETPDLN